MEQAQYLSWTKTKTPNPRDIPFIMSAIRERVAFENFYDLRNDFEITAYSFIESKSSWDIYFLSGGTNYLAEVKVRSHNSTDYNGAGWILEQKKYDKLIKYINTSEAKDKAVKAFYINIFNDGVSIWNIQEENNYNFFLKKCKKSTVDGGSYEDKWVTMLKIQDGVFYKNPFDLSEVNKYSQAIFRFIYPTTKISNDYKFENKE